jgi:hypothetical protein
MNRLPRQFSRGSAGKAIRIVVLSFACIAIAACSKGDGVQLGDGQEPDPVVIDFPIAYIKAPLPTDDNGAFEQPDLREQITFEFGSDLYFRDRAAVGALRRLTRMSTKTIRLRPGISGNTRSKQVNWFA